MVGRGPLGGFLSPRALIGPGVGPGLEIVSLILKRDIGGCHASLESGQGDFAVLRALF